MVIWAIIIFAMVFLVIPFGMGNLLVGGDNLFIIMIGGLFSGFCIFEILALLFHIALGSLRLQVALWCIICVAIALIGWRKAAQGERPPVDKGRKWTRIERALLLVVVVLVVFQTLNTVLNVYYGNWDDETYCGTAVTSWYTDTVDRYAPGFGVLQPAFYQMQYNIACWPVYSSMLAVLTGVHPAIIFRTILPLFEMPFTYYIAYRLAQSFWENSREKSLLALIYFQIFTLLAAEHMPQTSGEWWLIVNCWTGKALTTSIMTPLILWLLIQVEEKKQYEVGIGPIWRALMFVCWSGCFVSASLFFLVPMELAVWGGAYLLRTKRWRDFPKLVLCVGPTLICAVVTFF